MLIKVPSNILYCEVLRQHEHKSVAIEDSRRLRILWVFCLCYNVNNEPPYSEDDIESAHISSLGHGHDMSEDWSKWGRERICLSSTM